jgi:acetate kinase
LRGKPRSQFARDAIRSPAEPLDSGSRVMSDKSGGETAPLPRAVFVRLVGRGLIRPRGRGFRNRGTRRSNIPLRVLLPSTVATTSMKILVLNSGSSSQKSCLYELAPPIPIGPPAALWQAHIEWGLAGGHAELRIRNAAGESRSETLPIDSRSAALERMLDSLWKGAERVISGPSEIAAAGHRVVHGGHDFRQPTRVTPEVIAAISRLSEFAPLHNRAEVEGIRLIERILGDVPQVAVFDTAFHRQMPEAAMVYPGPYAWLEQGIRRYGFHGINHSYCSERAAQMLGKELASLRLITCHLGNGCSLAAVRDGRSIDTTMGFTPLEGLMMGSRSGSVDPGILIYLVRKGGYSADDLDRMLNRESGLAGLSGVSSDMREVLAATKQGNPRARLAFDVFIHRLRSSIGAMLASLGGLDALVFTAGIGENSPEARAGACEPFAFLGLEIDPSLNQEPTKAVDRDVASWNSPVRILVIRAQEEWAIASACWRLLHEAS